MAKLNKVEKILREISTLDNVEYRQVLEKILGLMKSSRQKRPANNSHSLLELRGLGKTIWKGVNPDRYVKKERASWRE